MKSLLPRRESPRGKLWVGSTDNPAMKSKDLLNHLPIELLLTIFQHLSTPADLLASIDVCQSWRNILLSPDIWIRIAERLTPGIASHIRASFPGSAATQEQAFRSTLYQHCVRDSGNFSLVTYHGLYLDDPFFTWSKQVPVAAGGVHSFDSVIGLDPDAREGQDSRLKLYSHGRVAWWPEGWHLPFFAVVDDLRARTRRMFMFPGQCNYGTERRRGWKTSMGEFLFIMGQEDAGVCIWHLEKNEMRQIRLPDAFERCVVEGERVLFVGRVAQVWLWTWDANAFQTIEVAAQRCYTQDPVTIGGQTVFTYPPDPRPAPKVGLRFREHDMKLDFILHPTNPNVFFVLTYNEVDLKVYEFTSGKLSQSIVLPHDHTAYHILERSRGVVTTHYLRHDRCDAYGGYCLVTVWTGVEPFCDDCGCSGSLGSVCFNVYTKEFTAFVHHALYQRTPDSHLWNGMLAVGTGGRQDPPEPEGDAEPLIVMLRPCDGRPPDGSTIRDGDPLPALKGRLPKPVNGARIGVGGNLRFDATGGHDLRPRPTQIDHAAFVVAARGGPKRGLVEPYEAVISMDNLTVEWITGDDKMLIYVVGKEYSVWRFGDIGLEQEVRRWSRAWKERWRHMIGSAGPAMLRDDRG